MRLVLPIILASVMLGFVDPKDTKILYPVSSAKKPVIQQADYITIDHKAFSLAKKSLTDAPYPILTLKPTEDIQSMLEDQDGLRKEVIEKTIYSLRCAKKQGVKHNHILTIIDFSLPSNKKRLWVFDLSKNKLLFHTHVSHGIKSGELSSTYFSNKVNSKTSSIGVFNTENSYRGRHGLSLKLRGLDHGINHNAYRRYIVMHGSWYMDEKFINKYGRPGRSWGCPALPIHLTKPIIQTIKGNSFFVSYYPGSKWLNTSKFLNCNAIKDKNNTNGEVLKQKEEAREDILFADLNNNNKRERHEPIIAMQVDQYELATDKKAPLKRMLRRQIDKTEYIALSNAEFKQLALENRLDKVHFIKPEVKRIRGYYATEMKIVEMGNIKSTQLNGSKHTVYFKNSSRSVNLKASNRFIRWLGL